MTNTTGNPIGRPKKKKNPVGRPKGEGAVMKEYRQRMLNSPKSRKVLNSIFDVAMDPEHKHWPSAMKLVADRILPVAGFEKDAGADKGRNAIQISITGVPGVNIGTEDPLCAAETALEGDFEEVVPD